MTIKVIHIVNKWHFFIFKIEEKQYHYNLVETTSFLKIFHFVLPEVIDMLDNDGDWEMLWSHHFIATLDFIAYCDRACQALPWQRELLHQIETLSCDPPLILLLWTCHILCWINNQILETQMEIKIILLLFFFNSK